MKISGVRHGADPRLYRVWINMRQRCYNPRRRQYKDWGGRGIRICKRWNKFENFVADMGPHPGAGWSLDRIDNNRGYSKSNCRWATSTFQNRNRRYSSTRKLTLRMAEQIRRRAILGVNASIRGNLRELAEEYDISYVQIHRIVAGHSWA